MDSWFIEEDGKTQGPLSLDVLKKLAEKGVVKKYTQVRNGEEGEWGHAKNVKELADFLKKTPSSPNASNSSLQQQGPSFGCFFLTFLILVPLIFGVSIAIEEFRDGTSVQYQHLMSKGPAGPLVMWPILALIFGGFFYKGYKDNNPELYPVKPASALALWVWWIFTKLFSMTFLAAAVATQVGMYVFMTTEYEGLTKEGRPIAFGLLAALSFLCWSFGLSIWGSTSKSKSK